MFWFSPRGVCLRLTLIEADNMQCNAAMPWIEAKMHVANTNQCKPIQTKTNQYSPMQTNANQCKPIKTTYTALNTELSSEVLQTVPECHTCVEDWTCAKFNVNWNCVQRCTILMQDLNC